MIGKIIIRNKKENVKGDTPYVLFYIVGALERMSMKEVLFLSFDL